MADSTSAVRTPAVSNSAVTTPAVEPEVDTRQHSGSSDDAPKTKDFAEQTPNVINLTLNLPEIIQEAAHSEMWGVDLGVESIPRSIIVIKFLKANGGNVALAQAQLLKALVWRKKVNPAKLLAEKKFDVEKFGGLGFVSVYRNNLDVEVITWNVYGGTKDIKLTFGDVDEFVEWRAALMELSVQQLNLSSATVPITLEGPDPYQMIQVHDYLGVSMLRMDPGVRAASKKVIEVFALAYPELLKGKYFVNVPFVLSFLFPLMKVFSPAKTTQKFLMMSYATNLAPELGSLGAFLPKAYGGFGADASDGLTVKYATASGDVGHSTEIVPEASGLKEESSLL